MHNAYAHVLKGGNHFIDSMLIASNTFVEEHGCLPNNMAAQMDNANTNKCMIVFAMGGMLVMNDIFFQAGCSSHHNCRAVAVLFGSWLLCCVVVATSDRAFPKRSRARSTKAHVARQGMSKDN